ncbi:hypothetical protein ACUN0C_18975 [Faunimonas sp. B44]|uniref:hypothetical protein n=1 Tax=Faunimonas sp. B44 TaxID=3461493 RepID=UPI004044FE9A
MITRLVGDLHVSAKDAEVVRHINRKLAKSARTFTRRDERHKLIRACIEQHHKNQELVAYWRL